MLVSLGTGSPVSWTPQCRGGRAPGLCRGAGSAFVTDTGNSAVDCGFGAISDPAGAERELTLVIGVRENGPLLGRASLAFISTTDGSAIFIGPR
jgi:ribose 5-phosphate isomerase